MRILTHNCRLYYYVPFLQVSYLPPPLGRTTLTFLPIPSGKILPQVLINTPKAFLSSTNRQRGIAHSPLAGFFQKSISFLQQKGVGGRGHYDMYLQHLQYPIFLSTALLKRRVQL